ncbi:universal stress protein [Algoriphagus antarcticus]|jgi:nucleotide-binding universal stress UspA family protein|uniref:Nucleotide-binding universal stress UspA family protein n=1 Tax=Algoriphagus antarcticus TaxID=238540 RepID=A0A3E0D6H3_9BACT|nr:universal stress protein [Algoriphagus antarcticus]REG77602.1 nucleotide-binding universal stress UspA family protein [Algoriphagus antarcticus]
MKKILVPCDFSDSAIQAFKFALQIAKQSKGEIILLHVVEPPFLRGTMLVPPLYFEENFLNDMTVSAEKNFEELKSKWANEGIKIHTLVEHGPTTKTINRIAEENKADLIVMGTQGATGFKEFLVGSNTEKVVRFSSLPVLAIRKSLELSRIKNIVFPTTLDPKQNKLLSHIRELQNFFSAKLHLLLVNTPHNMKRTSDEKVMMEEYAKEFDLQNYTINTRNDFYESDSIINFTNEIQADMIAMGTHSRKGLAHLFSGSMTEDVVNRMDCPIWTYSIKD